VLVAPLKFYGRVLVGDAEGAIRECLTSDFVWETPVRRMALEGRVTVLSEIGGGAPKLESRTRRDPPIGTYGPLRLCRHSFWH